MNLLGSTARSMHDGFYELFPFMKPEETENGESDPVSDIRVDILDLEGLFRCVQFENDLERVKAEIFVKDFDSQSADMRRGSLRQLSEISRPAAIEILKRLLSSRREPLDIAEILDALSGLNTEGALEKRMFARFLGHPNPILRQAALRALAKYRDEEAFSMLSSSIKDPDAGVRKQALNCMGWFFSGSCIPFVLKSLHDTDASVKKTAIRISRTLVLSQSVPSLLALLNDPDIEIQNGAVISLRKITGRNLGSKIYGSKKIKEAAVRDFRSWWRKNQDLVKKGGSR